MVNLDKSSEDELLRFRELDYRTTVLISGRQRKLGHLNIWRRKIYLLRRRRKTEKEKDKNIWIRKILFCGGEYRTETEKETYIWRRKIFFGGGEEERRKRRRKIFLHRTRQTE